MKKIISCSALLLFPILAVVLLNEYSRAMHSYQYTRLGTTTLNSSDRLTNTCSWACHDDTNYCKQHHVSFLRNHFATTDPLYFGIINGLGATGNYGWANILVLVLLIPGLIYILLIKSINLQFRIRALQKERDGNAN